MTNFVQLGELDGMPVVTRKSFGFEQSELSYAVSVAKRNKKQSIAGREYVFTARMKKSRPTNRVAVRKNDVIFWGRTPQITATEFDGDGLSEVVVGGGNRAALTASEALFGTSDGHYNPRPRKFREVLWMPMVAGRKAGRSNIITVTLRRRSNQNFWEIANAYAGTMAPLLPGDDRLRGEWATEALAFWMLNALRAESFPGHERIDECPWELPG